MASTLFGWDLLIRSVESEIKCNEDVIVAFTHMVLISNGFKCIGLGESQTLGGSETQTEALPAGWSDTYALRYLYQGRLYNLKCTKLDDSVLINLIRVDERTTAACQFATANVASRSGSLDQMLPKNNEMVAQVKNALIDKCVVSSKSQDQSSQTEPPRSQSVRRTDSRDYFPTPSRDLREPIPMGPPPVGVGGYDLDPLGVGRNPLGTIPPMGQGGGMLYQPPPGPRYPQGPNVGLPPGSIPPGARFDPFRPPDDRFPRNPLNRPDNDEMPPPGYDDMFM